jgi:SAM-dependent methyltransferase
MSAPFDAYALNYDAALNRGLSISGESKDYFARERVRWTAGRLRTLGAQPTRVLDYGCGIGSAGPELLRELNVRSVTGVDASPEILAAARRAHVDQRLEFGLLTDVEPSACFDLAFCNGVFHHIEPAERLDALAYIHRSLTPAGYFAFWENNPWNPGTRMVMRRIPFDHDAKLLWPSQAGHLLRRAGFHVLRTDFAFLFPRVLSALRPLEARLASIPAGAQYLVLSQKR